MNLSVLLHWQYLIFILPFAISGFLLLLSSVHSADQHGGHLGHMGHGSGHAGHGAAGNGASGHAHTGANSQTHHAAGHHSNQSKQGDSAGRNPRSVEPGVTQGYSTPMAVIFSLVGCDRVPLPMVIETFGVLWGIAGCIANQALLANNPDPTFAQVTPSLWIALAGGAIGGRIVSEIIGRLLPQDESQAISKDSLYGLKGKVAYKVSSIGGRALFYDTHGTLHDETCRVEEGAQTIEKGRTVLVVDRNSAGYLIVEEISE